MPRPVKLSPWALPSNSVMAVLPEAQAAMVPPVPSKMNSAVPAPVWKPVVLKLQAVAATVVQLTVLMLATMPVGPAAPPLALAGMATGGWLVIRLPLPS